MNNSIKPFILDSPPIQNNHETLTRVSGLQTSEPCVDALQTELVVENVEKASDYGFYIFRIGAYLGVMLSIAIGLLGSFYKTSLQIIQWPGAVMDVPFLKNYAAIPGYLHWLLISLIGVSIILVIMGGEMMLHNSPQ